MIVTIISELGGEINSLAIDPSTQSTLSTQSTTNPTSRTCPRFSTPFSCTLKPLCVSLHR